MRGLNEANIYSFSRYLLSAKYTSDTVLALCYTEKTTVPTAALHVMHMNGLTEQQILHERRRGMVIDFERVSIPLKSVRSPDAFPPRDWTAQACH